MDVRELRGDVDLLQRELEHDIKWSAEVTETIGNHAEIINVQGPNMDNLQSLVLQLQNDVKDMAKQIVQHDEGLKKTLDQNDIELREAFKTYDISIKSEEVSSSKIKSD